MKTKRDWRGRIKRPGSNCHGGHSVCNVCGKDMPGCWEVVCSKCWRTFCYKHARVSADNWICVLCEGKLLDDLIREPNILTSMIETFKKWLNLK